jgi:hypothetical protein
MFLSLPDPYPDPLVTSTVRIRIRLRILPFSNKSVKRTEISVAKKKKLNFLPKNFNLFNNQTYFYNFELLTIIY